MVSSTDAEETRALIDTTILAANINPISLRYMKNKI